MTAGKKGINLDSEKLNHLKFTEDVISETINEAKTS